MKTVACTIAVAFIVMALFSFGVMDHPMSADASATCLASKIQNGDCPPEDFSAAAALFHLNAFHVFSLAVLALGLILLAVAALFLSRLKRPPMSAAFLSRGQRVAPSDFPAMREERSALARFELSPAI